MPIKLLPLPKQKVIVEPPIKPKGAIPKLEEYIPGTTVAPTPGFYLGQPPPEAYAAIAPTLLPKEGDNLPDALKRLYPDKPEMTIDTIQTLAVQDPDVFLKDLMDKNMLQEAETVLRALSQDAINPDTGTPYTPAEIDSWLDDVIGVAQRQKQLETLVAGVYPKWTPQEFADYVETDFESFLNDMQTGGQTAEKLALLNRGLGIPFQSETEIDIQDFFAQIKIVVPIDDVRQLVTITSDGKAYNQKGQWVGTYNRAAKRFTAAKTDEGFIKDSILDPWCFAANRLGHSLTQFGASVLPNILFRDLDDIDRKTFGDDWVDKANASNKVIRDKFRKVYALNQKDFDEWVVKHPELIPKPEYEEGLSEHPELLLDPAYFAYEFASTAPISLGVMALVAGGVVTGQPALGVLAGAIMMTPAESTDAYQALLNAGAPETEAAGWGLLIGTSASLIETFSDLIFLKVVAAPVVSLFRKEVEKQMAKAIVGYCLKKGTFAFIETNAIEVAEEVLTLAISNAALKVYDENVNIWDDMVRTAAKTFAAVAPMAVFAGASTMVGISRQQAGRFTDAQKIEQGWLQDPASKEWLRPMTSKEITLKLKEAGAVEVVKPTVPEVIAPELVKPLVPTKVTPVTPEVTKLPEGFLVRGDVELVGGKRISSTRSEVIGGAWFTNDINVARIYGKELSYTREPSNPMRVETRESPEKYIEDWAVGQGLERVKNDKTFFQSVRNLLKEKGYDAVEFNDPILKGKEVWMLEQPELTQAIPEVGKIIPTPVTPEVKRTMSLEEISKLETRLPLDLLWKDEKVFMDKLTTEVKEKGITEPITIRVREDGSQIVWDGLHRLAIAQKLGIKNIPVTFIGEIGQLAIPKAEVGIPEVIKLEITDKDIQHYINLGNTKPTSEALAKLNKLDLVVRVEGHTGKPGIIPFSVQLRDGSFITNATKLKEFANTEWAKAQQIKPEVPTAPPIKPPAPPVEGVVAPPPPKGAARRVFDRIQIEPAETGFIEKVRQGYHKFQVKMVDDLYSIKRFTEAYTKGGVELSIEENPYLLARLLKGIASKANVFIEQGTFGKTFWKMEKGRAVPNFTGESLENILKEVKEPGVWQDFSTYLVAKRAFDLSMRGIETGISEADSAAAISELEDKHDNFSNLGERIYKYQDNLLVYGQEMGLISEDLLGKLRKYGNYVPFYRVFNELQAKGFMGKKMADIASPIKRIKGSEREIINPLESIIKNTYVIISAADRNQVGIMMANLVDKNPELADMFERVKTPIARVARVGAKELGVEIEGLSEEDAEAVVDIFRPSFFVRGDEVTVLIDGKKAYFKVDPDLRNGLLNLDRESVGMVGKFLSYPAKWLRAGATLSPDFMVRNPTRDALTAFVYSNYNFLPGVDFMRGVAGIIRKDADYQLYRASGAEHSMMVSMDREYLHKTFSEIVQGKKFTNYIKHPLELFQIISELGEKATRLGEFKAGIRRGAIPLEAGYSARAVTLDFAQAGTTAHAVNRLIAFFNANIRGWGKMFSSFKEHPVRTSAKVFVGITLPSILLYYANRDDPRWKEIPQWQKDLFWIVMTKDNIYRIPKPFELGILFGSIPERFLEWLDNKDPKLMKDVLVNFTESGSPGFIPTAGLPILEWITNYSFFRGQKIVPASREKMPPELQYTRWTSEVSKKLGELLNLPPAKIDNLINGWTGGLGRYAIDILDGILKKTGISPDIPEPSPELADIPVIKAFVVRNPYGSSGEVVESFYNILEKYEQGEKYLQEMLKLGEQEKFEAYKASHPELVFLYELSEDPEKEGIHYSASARYLRRVARDLSELGKKQDLIYKATDITPVEKRRLIDEIDILKTDITRKALNLLLGKEPMLLQDSLNESINRLGEMIEETPVLSLEKPDIFDMKHLHTDFGTTLEAATKEDLDKLTNIDPLAFAYLEVKGIEKTIDPILNKKIYEIMPDLKEGVTFEDYYKAWQGGIIKDEVLDNLSRRQVELLRKYHGLDKAAQKQFLKDNPELSLNPRDEWLKSHPKENAQLAVWGQAKILTKEAYNQFLGLLKTLDIPDSAIPPLTLPPATSIDTHFAYEEMVAEGKQGSWEAQLLLLKDAQKAKDAKVQPYAGIGGFRDDLTLSDTPIASLEIKTKPEYRQIYNKIQSLSDNTSPDYIADEDARAEAVKKLKTPEYIDNTRRIEAIEKGTDDNPISDAFIKSHVEYGRIQDKEGVGSSSAESMLYRVDHPEYDKFRTDEVIWGDNALKPIDQTRIPIWRIDVKYRKEDTEYQAILDKYEGREETIEAKAYLAGNEAYRKDRRRRQAYGLSNSKTGYEFPDEQVENYVAYNELSIKGFRRDRFLVENPEFADALYKAGQIADLPDPAKVPAVQYDDIYDQYTDQFDEIEGNGKPESEWFEPDKDRREARDKELRFDADGKYTEFGLAEIRRNAYGKFVPENHIENYVGYYKIIGEGKPKDLLRRTGTDLWYEDDWFMMEHPDFYKEVYLNKDIFPDHERKDYRKVPTRKVFAKYLIYLTKAEGKPRQDYRFANLDLDEWGQIAFGWKSIKEQKIREELTPTEIFEEEISEREKSAEEILKEIEEGLARLRK